MKAKHLYRCRARQAPSFYVGGRMGDMAKMVDKKHAWKRTRYWWRKNTAPGVLKFFRLELVKKSG